MGRKSKTRVVKTRSSSRLEHPEDEPPPPLDWLNMGNETEGLQEAGDFAGGLGKVVENSNGSAPSALTIREMIRQELQSLSGLGEGRGALSCAPNLDQNNENMLIKGMGRHEASLAVGTLPKQSISHDEHDGNDSPPVKEDLQVKIRPFNPKETDWFSYRAHFEGIAIQASWSERTKCTRLLASLQGNLTGIAVGMPSPVRFTDLVARIDGVYGLSNSHEDAALKLSSCRIGQEESVALFAERVRQLVERAYPAFTQVDKEQQSLRAFTGGLPNKHDMRLQMRMKSFNTLREAAEYGSKLEHVIKDEKQNERKCFSSREADSEITEMLRHMSSDVRLVRNEQVKNSQSYQHAQTQGNSVRGKQERGANRSREPRPCYACGQQGHWVQECALLQAFHCANGAPIGKPQ